MMISSKGRYLLLVLIDLAKHADHGYIPMKDVAQRQNLSLKYLERILPTLSKNDVIIGLQGKGGGYRLRRSPAEYTLGEILRLAEGSLSPVPCLENKAKACEHAAECRTLPIWTKLDSIVNEYLDSLLLSDLL